jgi:hypothetical protein
MHTKLKESYEIDNYYRPNEIVNIINGQTIK